MKNILAGALALGVLGLSYAAVAYVKVYSSSIEPGSYRSFSVSGEGKVVVVPDVAEISFALITEGGKNIAAIQKENTEKANRAIEFVKSQGVKKEDIKTSSWNLQPKYQYYRCDRPVIYQPDVMPENGGAVLPRLPKPCPPPEIVGYTLTQSIQIKIRDFDKVGDILSGITESGANQISGPNFTVDDPYKAQNEARAEAIRRAREKAEALARAGGFSLGRLLGIDEGGYPGPYYAYGRGGVAMAESAADMKGAPAPLIEPGSQEVQVTVNLRFEIR